MCEEVSIAFFIMFMSITDMTLSVRIIFVIANYKLVHLSRQNECEINDIFLLFWRYDHYHTYSVSYLKLPNMMVPRMFYLLSIAFRRIHYVSSTNECVVTVEMGPQRILCLVTTNMLPPFKFELGTRLSVESWYLFVFYCANINKYITIADAVKFNRHWCTWKYCNRLISENKSLIDRLGLWGY